jgi:hypothetical protein
MNDENRLPEHAYKYFWDINPAELDVSEYPRYVIERLLEYGEIPELRWLFVRFSSEEIVEVLKRTRTLSCKRANSWEEVIRYFLQDSKVLVRKFAG